jgi:RNA polymerase sigma-70 factor (ECF subfamily)
MSGAVSSTIEPGTLDDETLLARIAGGDSTALEILYARYSRVVYSLALRLLASPELAEEVTQETFWRVWRRSTLFQRSRGQVAAWIFGIAHNLAIDELRRQRVRPVAVYDRDDQPVLRERTDERADAAAPALERERRALVRGALEQLPPEQREVIELAYFSGLAQSEIAERLGRPLGTIKTRVRLALQKLRDILMTQGLEPEDIGD